MRVSENLRTLMRHACSSSRPASGVRGPSSASYPSCCFAGIASEGPCKRKLHMSRTPCYLNVPSLHCLERLGLEQGGTSVAGVWQIVGAACGSFAGCVAGVAAMALHTAACLTASSSAFASCMGPCVSEPAASSFTSSPTSVNYIEGA